MTAPQRSAAETGFRVQSDGSFFYPFIGQVVAAGRAPEDARSELMDRLSEFITDPQIEVRIAAFNSQAINVTGAVSAPRRHPLTTVPLRLIDAVNAAGGLQPEADVSRVRVQRWGRPYQVNPEKFLDHGSMSGSPSCIDLGGEPVSLKQALARQGGLDQLRADVRGIFVFPGDVSNMTVFQLDVTSPTGFLLGTKFQLSPGDVIYVTRSPLQHWNDTINSLLPTLVAVNTTGIDVNGN